MKRIAMWSGPRNISTAMMRSFENRADTRVVDEPFYAHYLITTGLAHPGAADVIADQPNDWRVVAKALAHDADPHPVYYQKHMSHHLCGDMDLDWAESIDHAFLLREPRAMLLSLNRVLDDVTVSDTGLTQQQALFRTLRDQGKTPPVIDSRDVLEAPQAMLRSLCAALDLPFDENMLGWPAGPRDSDGVWAPHWYSAVEQSTGFAPYRPAQGELPPQLLPVLEQCQPIYDELYAYRITV